MSYRPTALSTYSRAVNRPAEMSSNARINSAVNKPAELSSRNKSTELSSYSREKSACNKSTELSSYSRANGAVNKSTELSSYSRANGAVNKSTELSSYSRANGAVNKSTELSSYSRANSAVNKRADLSAFSRAMARPTSLQIETSSSVHDYNNEAHNLWTRLGITPGENSGRYNVIDVIYRSAAGGTIYVGDSRAAQNLNLLQAKGIVGVVNCTSDIPNFHATKLQYYNFDVAWWKHKVGLVARAHPLPDEEVERKLVAFLRPMLQFIEYYICQGKSVLVHCLAGAHRAGSTGIICLMHFAGLDAENAVATAKSLRPIIEMISNFPELVRRVGRLKRNNEARIKF